PLGGIEATRAMDPTTEELKQLIDVLRRCFQTNRFTVADCARLAEEQEYDLGGRARYKRQDLRDAMTIHGRINTKSFGRLIMRHRDRVVDGWSIRVETRRGGRESNAYYLDGPPQSAQEGMSPM